MQIDLDRDANVVDAAIGTLGAVAAGLPWPQYEQLLNQHLRSMKSISTKVRRLVSWHVIKSASRFEQVALGEMHI